MFQEITIANFNVQRLADYCLVRQIQDRVADAEEPQVLAVFHQQKEYTPVSAQKHDSSTSIQIMIGWKWFTHNHCNQVQFNATNVGTSAT